MTSYQRAARLRRKKDEERFARAMRKVLDQLVADGKAAYACRLSDRQEVWMAT